MIAELKRQAKSAEYRARADDAAALADASPLANVREKHQAAAVRWTELAVLYESAT